MIGTPFSHYTIQSKLGDGGFSQVYAAYDTRRRETVALKLLDASVARSAEGSQRFLREVEAARRLRSRHIVPVYDSGIVDGRAFLAMRLMRGGTLADRLAGGRILDANAAAQVMRHTARALDHGRRLGVIHRDVKPSNIFYQDTRVVCLGDFGLAKVHGLGTVTHQGQVIGSVYYMAPEQIRGLIHMTALSDVYALGVVLYEMLTGHLPFEGQSQAGVLHAIVHSSPVRPSRYSSAISPEVERIILRALHKDANQRFSSAGQLASAYQKAAGQRGMIIRVTRPSQPAPPAGVSQPRTKPATTDPSVFWAIILVLAVIFILALIMSSG